jgi:hypothetical protein
MRIAVNKHTFLKLNYEGQLLPLPEITGWKNMQQ